MKKISLLFLVLMSSSFVTKAEFVSEDKMIVTYRSNDNFETVKENIQQAITNKGLIISGTLHVSEMLNRTAKDLGISKNVYQKAEAFEFCSAVISHKMIQVNPLNLTACPFTIAFFVKPEETNVVYLAFRKPQLAGESQEITQEINNFLHGIVKEATGEF
ncbi:MAG: hypothetical protein RIT27_503 [Pseudomonadota bacterium]|jgi:uncharacterized protein (DUF302 family)